MNGYDTRTFSDYMYDTHNLLIVRLGMLLALLVALGVLR